jgi:hypothetical protein
MTYRRFAAFRPHVTRLRVLRSGWGRFTTEEVTLADLGLGEPDEPDGRGPLDIDEILDLDDEDAETGLRYGRERRN